VVRIRKNFTTARLQTTNMEVPMLIVVIIIPRRP